jgi:hypothetical protein
MRTSSIFLVASALALAACGGSASPEPKTPTTEAHGGPGQPHADGDPAQAHGPGGHEHGHDMKGSCPMAVPNTTARAEDVEGGVALAFTTTGDVAELRKRVAHMAEMHGHMAEMHQKMMPHSQVRSEEIEGGARLVFTPEDPAKLDELREHARKRAEKMKNGECPMMAMHGEHGGHEPQGEHEGHEALGGHAHPAP